MDNDEVRDKAFKLGFGYERDFGNCAQCVYKAVSETFGVESDEVFRAAYGLAGGGGGMGMGSCSAYSGGLMEISSRYGRQRFTDGKQSIADDLGRRFYEMFVENMGAVSVEMSRRRFLVSHLIFVIRRILKNSWMLVLT